MYYLRGVLDALVIAALVYSGIIGLALLLGLARYI